VRLERPQLAAETSIEKDIVPQKGKSPETVASKFSTRHLVWKDKHGTVGFGNCQYPEMNEISHINVNGTWEQVKD
jgi:hypothetical protein